MQHGLRTFKKALQVIKIGACHRVDGNLNLSRVMTSVQFHHLALEQRQMVPFVQQGQRTLDLEQRFLGCGS